MSRRVKTAILLCAIFASLAWTLFAWRQKATGGSTNNGYTQEWGPAKGKFSKGPKISDAQLEQVIAAKKSGDFDKAREIMEASLTPEQRQLRDEQRLRKVQRGIEMEERTRSILGDEQYEQLMAKKKALYVNKKGGEK